MKKIFFISAIVLAAFYITSCSDSDIDYSNSQDVNEIDTVTINEKAKDTTGIELFITEKYLIFDNKEERFWYYAEKEGVMAFNPLLLPEGDNPALPKKDETVNSSFKNPYFVQAARLADVSDGNLFYGFASACAIRDTGVFIVGDRMMNSKDRNDFSDNYMMMERKDGSFAYSNVFRYAPYGTQLLFQTYPCVGSNGKDTIVVKAHTGLLVGVYKENQDTITWDHYPRAFEHLNAANMAGDRYYQYQPRQIVHNSKFGFMMFLGSQLDAATIKPGYILSLKTEKQKYDSLQVVEGKVDWAPKYAKSFSMKQDIVKDENGDVVYLKDEDGKIIEINGVPQPKMTDPYRFIEVENLPKFEEVSVLSIENDDLAPELPKGSMLVMGYYKDKIYQSFYKYKEGDKLTDVRFDTAFQANIMGTLSKRNPLTMMINPVTKKVEVVLSTPMSMDLYSMDVATFVGGSSKLNSINRKRWMHEAELVDRDISIRGNGMYPIGVISNPNAYPKSHYMKYYEEIEGKKFEGATGGVQRIIISCGDEYPARVGVFEIDRLWDTDKLSKWIGNKRSFIDAQPY